MYALEDPDLGLQKALPTDKEPMTFDTYEKARGRRSVGIIEGWWSDKVKVVPYEPTKEESDMYGECQFEEVETDPNVVWTKVVRSAADPDFLEQQTNEAARVHAEYAKHHLLELMKLDPAYCEMFEGTYKQLNDVKQALEDK